MHGTFINIQILITAAILSLAASSCIYDDEPAGPVSDKDSVRIVFTLNLSENQTRQSVSRASVPDSPGGISWGDEYTSEGAIDFENRILRDNFEVTFYNADNGRYIGQLIDVECTDVSSATGDAYRFSGRLAAADDENMTTELFGTMNVKMMVTANVASRIPELSADYSGVSTAGGRIMYSQCGRPGASFEAIPMWGVSTKIPAGIVPNRPYDWGEIYLLRAMAKVQVLIDRTKENLEGVKLESVSVSRANTSGFVLPGNWNVLSQTADLKFSETLRVPAGASTATDLTYAASGVDGDEVTFYLPECVNGGDDGEITLTVNYTAWGQKQSGEIRLCPYVDGRPVGTPLWDIVRNHIYRYTVVSASFDLMYTVCPWNRPGDVDVPMYQ